MPMHNFWMPRMCMLNKEDIIASSLCPIYSNMLAYFRTLSGIY